MALTHTIMRKTKKTLVQFGFAKIMIDAVSIEELCEVKHCTKPAYTTCCENRKLGCIHFHGCKKRMCHDHVVVHSFKTTRGDEVYQGYHCMSKHCIRNYNGYVYKRKLLFLCMVLTPILLIIGYSVYKLQTKEVLFVRDLN